MSAPFLLGKVIDTIYSSGADIETMTASLTSLCIMLTGVFLCGGAANAARVYLMEISGKARTERHRHSKTNDYKTTLEDVFFHLIVPLSVRRSLSFGAHH